MTIHVVAGEASGDARGEELIRSLRVLRPGIQFSGLGGPRMRALAPAIDDWIDQAGVIGIIDVLRHYPFFKRRFDAALAEIDRLQPDAVVLIDYPGFNLRLAKALRKRGTRAKIIDYISPQVWAWNRRRIPEMARSLDLMLCIFPFEQALYEESGLKTIFVGHPMLDSLARTGEPRDETLVGLFPGSRKREIARIFPTMLATAALIKKARPELRFEAAAASERMGELMESMPHAGVEIGLRNSHSLMQRASAGMVASGTATLEATFFGLPFALVYRVAPLTYAIARRLVRLRWIGIANILAGREIVREFIQGDAEPAAIADELLRLLNSSDAREALVRDLESVIAQLGEPGASARAAGAILAEVEA